MSIFKSYLRNESREAGMQGLKSSAKLRIEDGSACLKDPRISIKSPPFRKTDFIRLKFNISI